MVKIYLILTWSTFLTSLVFVILYNRFARWRETSFGRSLMTYQICMTVLLGDALVQSHTGAKSLGFQIAGMLIYSGVPCALIWRIVVLIRLQRSVSRDPGNGEES